MKPISLLAEGESKSNRYRRITRIGHPTSKHYRVFLLEEKLGNEFLGVAVFYVRKPGHKPIVLKLKD